MKMKYLDMDPRVAKQDAKNAVRDPLDALIELITNSMDSYNRMKARGEYLPPERDGKIEVYLQRRIRKEKKAIIAVKDWAEGISPEKMKEYISGYGRSTSGKEFFQSIRGFFGRGLKDAVGGLDGIGRVYSVKNRIISYGYIDGSDKKGIKYNDEIMKFGAAEENLKKYHLDDGARTIALVEFSTENIKVPNFDTFAEKLTLCVQLRPIMEKGNITLIQVGKNGKELERRQLRYNYPKGELLLLEKKNTIPGELATYDIEIYKAEEPLTQSEEGKFRVGGLEIMSGTSVHEATLLKFEKDPNASSFFGKVRCDYIDELMRKDEAVVTPDRKGLNWDHPFLRKLEKEIEKKLRPFVEEERKRRNRKKKGISEDTIKRNEKLGRKLGKLYKEILKEMTIYDLPGSDEDGEEYTPKKPSGGFEFIPPYYIIERTKKQRIRLVVESPRVIESFETITLESTNNNIIIPKNNFLVGEGKYNSETGFFVHNIEVIGERVGESSIIAKTKNKKGEECFATCMIFVKEIEEYPQNGFAFLPSEYRIKLERMSSLTLKIDSKIIRDKTMSIKIESNNPYIIIETPKILIENHRKGIIEKQIHVRGTKIGEVGIVTAKDSRNPTIKAEAKVKVISSTKRSAPKGFEIEFDWDPKPIQRALCKDDTIYIFVKEPTVKMYFGENGEYDGTLSFQILCADLITEAFCIKVVEDLDREKKLIVLGEDKESSIRRKINELKRKLGPTIHKTYVDQKLLARDRNV